MFVAQPDVKTATGSCISRPGPQRRPLARPFRLPRPRWKFPHHATNIQQGHPSGRGSRDTSGAKFVVGRTEELVVFDDLLRGEGAHVLLHLCGRGGICRSGVFSRMGGHGRYGRALVRAAGIGSDGKTPGAILRALINSLIESDSGVHTEHLQAFSGQLDEYEAVCEIERQCGGRDRMFEMFETTGPLKDQTALRALLDRCDGMSESVQTAIRNRFSLDRYLRSGPQWLATGFAEALGAVLDNAHGSSAALLLDTYEDIRSQDRWVRQSLVPALPPGARMVILGRNQLTRQNVDWADYGDTTRVRPLPELTGDDAKAYLRHYGLIEPTALEEIYRFTGGYPLLLVLVRQLAIEVGWEAVGHLEHAGDRDSIARGLLDRILREERVHEVRDVLEKCAVASWISPEIISELLGVTPDEARDAFDKVRRYSFMERHPEGLRLHEKIRSLLVDRLRFTSRSEYDQLEEKLLAYHAKGSRGLVRTDP